MLILAVKDDSPIHIGKDITITLKRDGSRTKVQIDAPKEIQILRDEVYKRIHAMESKS